MSLEMTEAEFQTAIADAVKAVAGDASTEAVNARMSEISRDIASKTPEEIQNDPVLKLFSPRSFDKEKPDPRRPAQKAAALLRYTRAADGDHRRAIELADSLGDVHAKSALMTTDFDRGGSFIPSDMAAAFFEALRPRSIIRAAGATILPMPNGTVTVPGVTTGSTASHGAEGAEQNATTVTTGSVQMTQKRLMAVVIMSKEMLNVSDVRMDEVVARDLERAVSQAEDSAFINGDGTNGSVLGILRQASSALSSASSTGSTAALKNELKAMRKTVRANEHVVDPSDGAYLMDTDIEEDLMDVYQGDNLMYPEMASGRIRRYSYHAGNNMPTGVNAFADMGEVFIGQSDNIDYEVFNSGDVIDSAGTRVSLISSYQAAARIVMHHDINLRRATAISQRTGCDYSAL